METDNQDAATAGEPILRSAISLLQQFLWQFGLVPSRVFVYLKDIPFTNAQRKTFIQHERDGEMYLAVQSFMETLMSDELPPHALVSFMQALFDANYNPADPHINDGTWYVHDIITIACTYMPLQQALLDLLSHSQDEGQDQGQDVMHIQGVLLEMNNHRLLNPRYTPRILETLELQGMEAAIVHLLACVYANQVDILKERLLAEENAARENGNDVAMDAEQASGEENLQQHWVHSLVQCFEMHKDEGLHQRVPEVMLLAETWASVYNRLAFGQRGRTGDGDVSDLASDYGGSVASENTLFVGEEEEEEIMPGGLGERMQAREDIARNMDLAARKRRTYEYVFREAGHDIPHIMAMFRHQYQRIELESTTAPRQSHEQDDNSSVITGVSDSTENNSHVNYDDDDESEVSGNFRMYKDQIHTGPGEGDITLRAYQDEVVQWAREGKNVAIFLPTGTGKTFVVLKYVQECLSRPGLNRVVFLAPKVRLAEQQYDRFCQYFPKVTYFRCGRFRSCNAPFSELLDTYQVFVLTTQCLVEAIQRKEVKITDFSLIVLDECHHVGYNKHPYAHLMGLYLNEKCKGGASLEKLPQVIGMTASPGVGSSSNNTLESAVSHIKELCYKMDVEKICMVKTHIQDLKYYTNEPKHEIHTCPRRKFDGFKKTIEEIMELIENRMITCTESESDLSSTEKDFIKVILKAPAIQRGLPQYSCWVASLIYKLIAFTEHKNLHNQLFSMAEMLIIYQKSLVLNEDCESFYALEYLKEQTNTLEDQVPHNGRASIERKLLDQFNRYLLTLERVCNDVEDKNPKLEMLKSILLEIVEESEGDCACMVFVKTIQLTKTLEQWINENRQLRSLRPGRITGPRKADPGGMTEFDFKDVMDKFRRGEHKVLICTSAADEGLDLQACNVVVRYDYVTSLISMIQTRGRARQMDSKYCMLGSLTKGNIDREKGNVALERLMHQAVDTVMNEIEENSNSFLANMNQWQKNEYQRRQMEEQRATIKSRNKFTGNVYQLRCRKCHKVACMSTDFRMLDYSSRTVVARHFAAEWKRVETNNLLLFRFNLEKIAKVHCKNCSYDWGSLVRYTPTGRELPVLKIESFFLEDMSTGRVLKRHLKWSEAPFSVEDIDDDELFIPVKQIARGK